MSLLTQNLSDILAEKRSQADVFLNWGCGKDFLISTKTFLVANQPDCVRLAINKVEFAKNILSNVTFNALHKLNHFFSREEAADYMASHPGSQIVCRGQVGGYDGAGISIFDKVDDLPECRLYTLYQKKRREFRVHVFQDKVIKQQTKVRRNNATGDNRIWTTGNGFVFLAEEPKLPEEILADCRKLVHHIGLHFGAVDVIWNEYYNRYYLMEVNTAPDIRGSTAGVYANEIRQLLS